MQPNYRGLAFLLSIGSLPLGCNNKNDTDTDGGSSTTAGTDPAATGTDTTTATDPTQSTSSDPTTTGASATSQGDTGTDTQPTTAGDTGTDTGPTPTDPICIAYGEHYAGCFPPRDGVYADVLANNCEYLKSYGMVDGQACVDALDAFFVCLTMTDCAEIMSEDSTACMQEDTNLLTACPTLTGGDTDTGGSTG